MSKPMMSNTTGRRPPQRIYLSNTSITTESILKAELTILSLDKYVVFFSISGAAIPANKNKRRPNVTGQVVLSSILESHQLAYPVTLTVGRSSYPQTRNINIGAATVTITNLSGRVTLTSTIAN